MKRSEKDQVIAAVKEKAGKAKSMFFADFTGITVEEVSEHSLMLEAVGSDI